MESVPHARIAPDFLASNAQAHHDILYAVADLLDNSREAGAQLCSINVRTHASQAVAGGRRVQHTMLEIIDDGTGMTEHTMRRMLSIAYTEKDLTSGKHYGMGSTTSIPRLCKSAICFSVHESGHCTAGLLSTTFSKKAGFQELKVPQCSWNFDRRGADRAAPDSYCVRDGGVDERRASALTEKARRESLELMLRHSPFTTEAELLSEFDSLQAFGASAARVAGQPATGTRWVMWDINREFHLDQRGDAELPDIAIRDKYLEWPFKSSLRGFCEVLYYHDDAEERRGTAMTLAIDGDRVVPRNWSTYLFQRHTESLKPPGALTSLSTAKFSFGYSRPLKEVVGLFQDQSAGKNDHGAPYYNVSNYNVRVTTSTASSQQPAASSQQPAASSQQPASAGERALARPLSSSLARARQLRLFFDSGSAP